LEPCTERGPDKLPCVDWIIKKQIDRVVIGLLDPNPHICGKGYWRLLNNKIEVDLFPPELTKKIIDMNKNFINLHKGDTVYDKTFIEWMAKNKNQSISSFLGIGWGDILTLQKCPELREG